MYEALSYASCLVFAEEFAAYARATQHDDGIIQHFTQLVRLRGLSAYAALRSQPLSSMSLVGCL